MEISKATVKDLFSSTIESGVGLDIAKNHSGICLFENNEIKTYGFNLYDYDKNDVHAEFKMRLDFKNKLSQILQGKELEYGVIEDVYAGENFETVRKLLALNTVIDELMYEGVVKIHNFYRWKETTWFSNMRTLYKRKTALKSKIETQEILEVFEFDFYMQHKDDRYSEKARIFFEDICDATGMLMGLVAHIIQDKEDKINVINLKQSDIKVIYVNTLEDGRKKDKRVRETDILLQLEINNRQIEDSIYENVKLHPNDIIYTYIEPSKLGVYGMKKKFEFFENDKGYLIYYRKKKKVK